MVRTKTYYLLYNEVTKTSYIRTEMVGDCSYRCNDLVPKASITYSKNVHVHAMQTYKQTDTHKKYQAPRFLVFEALAWTFKK